MYAMNMVFPTSVWYPWVPVPKGRITILIMVSVFHVLLVFFLFGFGFPCSTGFFG
jgi:hypothetical protein